MKLAGKVAIVTGGGSGQGRATALIFARDGAKVVVADINGSGAEETARLIYENERGEAFAMNVDVSKVGDVRGLVDTAVSRYGRLDILINNAGITLWKGIIETTEEDWDRVVDTNLKGVFLGCKYAIPAMRRSGEGSIVNIASVAALTGYRLHFAYCAAKAGVINLTKALALDHGPDNIRINCICPGGVRTPMLEEVIDINDPMKVERLANQHALGRLADPEEVAKVSLFLCSKDASFITGAVLAVDGGVSAGRMGEEYGRLPRATLS